MENTASRDLYGKSEQLKKKLIQIKESDKLSAKNKKIIVTFLDWGKVQGNKGAGLSDARLFKYAVYLFNLAKWLDKDFPKADMNDIEKVVEKIKDNGFAASTITSYNIALRSFYKWLYGSEFVSENNRTDGDIYPKIVRWINTSEKNHSKRTADEIFSPEDIEKLVMSSFTPRDKALISSLFWSGCRIGEFLNLKIKDVREDPKKRGIFFDIKYSKTEPRSVLLIEAAPYVGGWLNIHPQAKDPEAFLWLNIKGEPMTVHNVHKILKMLQKRAGFTRKLFPHILRHSIITHKGKYLNSLLLRKFSGHSKNSKYFMTTYGHITDDDVWDAEARHLGMVDEDEKVINPIKTCVNCKAICGVNDTHCLKCGMPLDTEGLAKLAQEKDTRIDKLEGNMQKMFNQLIQRIEGSNDSKEWKNLVHQVRDSGANLHTRIEADGETMLDHEKNKRPLHELMAKAKVSVERDRGQP